MKKYVPPDKGEQVSSQEAGMNAVPASYNQIAS